MVSIIGNMSFMHYFLHIWSGLHLASCIETTINNVLNNRRITDSKISSPGLGGPHETKHFLSSSSATYALGCLSP